MATFKDLSTESGLKQLDDYLLTRTYISGHQASKDDIVVYLAVKETPSSKLVNASRWFNHISTLLQKSFPGVAVGVKAPQIQIQGVPVVAAHANGKADKEDDDDDLDLFGEETEEEKAAALEREGKLKESKSKKESGKSSVLMDVKPWDDETDMVKLEEAVRSVAMPGLYWGASKLQPVGYGIKKLQIMMTIEDDLVSVDNLIEDYLIAEPRNEHIQSCDIVAFNKI